MQGEIELSQSDLVALSLREIEATRRRIAQALETGVITYAAAIDDPVTGSLLIRVSNDLVLTEEGENIG